jgi:hypothetical protein
MFENKMLRRESESNRRMVSYIMCTFRLVPLQKCYLVIKVIKSRKMRRAGHIARIRAVQNPYKFWSKNLNGRVHLQELGIDGKIE